MAEKIPRSSPTKNFQEGSSSSINDGENNSKGTPDSNKAGNVHL